MAEVVLHAAAGMVAMAMGNNGIVYLPPWVNIYMGRRAVYSFIVKF
jgi:hypothetical protein